jgi:hypothetical protein
MNKKIYSTNAQLLLMLLLLGGCKNESPVANHQDVQSTLSIIDTTSTKAFLRITSNHQNDYVNIVIKRDSLTIFVGHIFSHDTIIVDHNLLPKHSYTYSLYQSDKQDYFSIKTSTLDTTNHSWNWTFYDIGDQAGTHLSDICVINDTLIYAVGEIHRKDINGNYELGLYNLIIWNGISWSYRKLNTNARLLYPGSGGDSILTIAGRAIYAFSPNDIWICAGSIFHFNGTEWIQYQGESLGLTTNKMWGSSSSNLYFAAMSGIIFRYNGAVWENINKITDLNIYDIYGNQRSNSNEYDILAVASNLLVSYDKKILQLSNTSIDSLSTTNIPYGLHGIWFQSNRLCIVVGYGVYTKHLAHQSANIPWTQNDITQFYLYDVKGNNVNDLIAVGGFGEIMHFNGISWHSYFQTTAINGNYERVSINKNICAVVGSKGNGAVIAIGERQ